MRYLVKAESVAEAATYNSPTFQPGMQKEGWRLWDGILRCNNTGTASATVKVVVTVTGEEIEPTVVAPGGKSSNTFKIPGQYSIRIDTVGAGGAILDVWLDGDTG